MSLRVPTSLACLFALWRRFSAHDLLLRSTSTTFLFGYLIGSFLTSLITAVIGDSFLFALFGSCDDLFSEGDVTGFKDCSHES